ncbi:cytochrome C nitrite reductase [Bibersteinia trehalosi]|uniref:Cytochrome C nitrite reductase n=1 Tax=Bibersteinia trehalosi TaxID=47735 RepID=A0A426FI78_BIBTR|nr:P-loop NTPase fold protein [Bibersteinia trehalosi]RRN04439.1 cytochrome C nitrite reductase [Bibersteinia trehalosi]
MDLINDNPIKDNNSDLLDRTDNAEKFAKHIFSFDYKEGLVVGICGEWGCGKTSYINLMRPELEKHSIVIDFNPWMFSDTHNLVSLFFTEMAAQLKEYNDNSDIADKLENFGELLSSVSSIPIISGIGAIFKFFSKKKINENSLQKQRKKLTEVLKKREKPITVILDDIDRLSSDELQSILRLVRLTGNFPNIIYLLSFDKERVSETLDYSNIKGKSYLEKIIQVTFDVPKPSQDLLEKNLFSSLESLLGNVNIDQSRWSQAYLGIIRPMIKNMRDIRRYVASLSNTFNQIGHSINTIDLLCLEAIKVFQPKTLKEIFEFRDILLSYSDEDKTKEKLVEFTEKKPINKSILGVLFNKYDFISGIKSIHHNSSFKKEKRIADKLFFELYFNQIETIELNDIELSRKLWSVMNTENFKEELLNINADSLENIVKNLMDYENEFNELTALYAIPALYQNLPRVPEKERGFWEFEADTIWSALTYRLLKNIPEKSKNGTIDQLLDSCDLFAQLEIVGIIGYRENRGHKLVSDILAKHFESRLTNNIKDSPISELLNTYKLSHILYFFVSLGNIVDDEILDSEEILLSLLKSSVNEIKSQKGDDPTIHRNKILHWDSLVKIYNNDEERLISMIEKLETQEYIDQEYVRLAIKYKNGYRHSDRFDDEEI